MDFLKIILLPESITGDSKDNQISQYKEAMQEKEVIVRNHVARINELEVEVAELKLKLAKMEYAMRGPNMDDNELAKYIICYDNIVQKLLVERNNLLDEKTELEKHIINLESSFQKLLKHYEKSKVIINEIMQNEKVCNYQIEEYKIVIQELQKKHNALIRYTQSQFAGSKIRKENIEEKISQEREYKDTSENNQILFNLNGMGDYNDPSLAKSVR